MRSEEEIQNMYDTLLELQKMNTKYIKEGYLGRLEVDEPDTRSGFRQALWWVLHED